MHYEKIFVEIRAKFLQEGGVCPLEIVWTDGKRYIIDKVKFIENKPCRTGGVLPIRYTVTVQGQERYLYYLKDIERWFLEKKI